MFLELREIEVGENWFNKNSENIVVVDDVFIEKGIVQVEYSYLEGDEEYPYCVADLDYFMKEYVRMPYSANEGEIMNNKVHFEGVPDWVASGAVDKDGSLYWYNAYAYQLAVNECWEEHGVNAYVEYLPNYPDCLDKYMFVGFGYNTDDWRNSAVDRDWEDY